MSIIDRILNLMNEQNITKADLYRLVEQEVKRSTFYNIFDKKTNPYNLTLDTIRPIAKALNTTIDYIVTGNETYKSNEMITILDYQGEPLNYELTEDDAKALKYIAEKMSKSNKKDKNE